MLRCWFLPILFQTTTDLRDTCTTKHTGTSASAPLGAGVMALLLEAKWVLVYAVNYAILFCTINVQCNACSIDFGH